jgi:NAD(P)-dependent dehydrogenase (short-subunit alcohol dehydrogenase family)
MKIVVIGASGTIGRPLAKALAKRHEVVRVAHTQGDRQADITSKESLEQLFEAVAPFDAVACAAGDATFKPLNDLSDADFEVGLESKLMGQVNVVRTATRRINDNGSVTLVSGVLADEPMPGSAAISLVNAGLNGFVRAAALELPRGIRINIVSPPWVRETLAAMGQDESQGMPAAQVVGAYMESVEGRRTGEVLRARDYIGKAQ